MSPRLGLHPLAISVFPERLVSVSRNPPSLLPGQEQVSLSRLWRSAGTFPGLAPSSAAQAGLQDIFIGWPEAASAEGSSGPPVQAIRAIYRTGSAVRAGWLTRGSPT